MARPSHPRVLAAALGLAVLVSADRARGDGSSFQLQLDTELGWLRRLPERLAVPALEQSNSALRVLPSANVRTAAESLVSIGAGASTSLVLVDRWIVPLIGLEFGGAIGASRAIGTSRDGTLVEIKPWTAIRPTLWVGGIGLRFKHRRWLFESTVRTGWSWLVMDVTESLGAERVEQTASASSPLLLGELTGCRRVDPTSRGCLFLDVQVYEFGWASGGRLGIRWAWGP